MIGRTLMMNGLVVLYFLVCVQAWAYNPYKLVIVADPAAKTRASEFAAYLKSLEPFRGLGEQLQIEIVEQSKAQMKCAKGCMRTERLICCDKAVISAIGIAHDANKTMAVTSAAEGGSGGDIVVLGTNYPQIVGAHELLHTYGFSDEYEYAYDPNDEDHSEAVRYCSYLPRPVKPNVTCFKPKSTYLSDQEARQLHGIQEKEIPWYTDIKDSTLITNGNQLGTRSSSVPSTDAALYQGGDCNQYPPASPCWKPYNEITIMGGYAEPPFIPPYYQKVILRKMEAERGENFIFSARSLITGTVKAFDGKAAKTLTQPSVTIHKDSEVKAAY